jgi:spermidine/putrescine-binding protein
VIEQVKQMLIRQKPAITTFHDDNGQDLLLAGDVDLVMEYNGDIAQVMREDKDLDFVVPKEGGLLASDSLCIPAGAPNADLAHAYINFVLDGHNGAEICKTIRYPTPNAAALALMPPDYRDKRGDLSARRRAGALRIFALYAAAGQRRVRTRDDAASRILNRKAKRRPAARLRAGAGVRTSGRT